MKRIDKAKVKTMVDVVKEFEKAYGDMPIPTWNQIHFYNFEDGWQFHSVFTAGLANGGTAEYAIVFR